MTTEVRPFAVTIPAGTLQSAPASFALTMPSRVVTGIRWRVPPGPRGQVGWALVVSGAHVFPFGDTGWIVADDETDRVDFTNAPQTGAWQLVGYNTGLLPHTVYLQFMLEPVASRTASGAFVPLVITA